MPWLNFITLNSVAPIPNLHEISDAGAGEGLMQLHPTRDTELIVCGKANTLLNGEYSPSPLLGNGSVTPAILVHGIFKALQKKGYKIRLHCYQLGLDNMPDFNGNQLDEVVVHHCLPGEETELIKNRLIPELKRQAEYGEEHLIAESGIGGTTFATLWLRHWLSEELWFAGSTKDPDKLAIKSQLLQKLKEQCIDIPLDAEQFFTSTELSDPVQRACCALLESPLEMLNFAGGAMIFAPVIAMSNRSRVKKISVATTRWVLNSEHARIAAAALPENCSLAVPETQFHQSEYEAVRMYERGYVTEGCGLGACLVFAEQHNLTGLELINSLDKAVTPWFRLN